MRTDKEQLKTITTIQGGACVSAHMSIAWRVKSRIISRLESLDENGLNQMDDDALQRASKEFDDVQGAMLEANAFVNAARVFCGVDNLIRFAELVQVMPKKAVNSRVHRILDRLSTSTS